MYKIRINNTLFRFFESYTLDMKFNAIADSFSFSGQKDFLPDILSYADCEILDENDQVIITGTIVNQNFELDSNPTLISVSGYSKPGVLEDCTIPISLYPLQSDNLSLKQIADKVLQPFDVKYKYTANITTEFNKKFKKTNAEPTQQVKEYLNQLASQRGIILTHNAKGELLFTKLDVSPLLPVANFIEGDTGILSMNLQIPGQSLHSEITVIKQASYDNPDAGQKTLENVYCKSFRPMVKILNSGDIFDIEKAARTELSNELSQIKLVIQTTKLVYPGNLITVKAPSLKIFNEYDFFVEETNIQGSTTNDLYILTCVVKDVYTLNYPPEYIFEEKIDFNNTIPKF
jgi:prophage tail gpP-like protein